MPPEIESLAGAFHPHAIEVQDFSHYALVIDVRTPQEYEAVASQQLVNSQSQATFFGQGSVARGFMRVAGWLGANGQAIYNATLRRFSLSGVRDEYQLQQVIRRTIGGWVGGKIRRRPMIIPVVIEA